MKKKIGIVILAALALAVTAAFGQAKTEKKIVKRVVTEKMTHAPSGPCVSGLTDEQRKKADALELETEKAALPLRARIEVLDAELRQLMLADKPDAAAVERKIEEIGGLKTQIEKKRAMRQIAVRGLLTPEQRVDFDRKTLGRGHGMGLGPMGPEGRDFLTHRGGEGPLKQLRLQRHFPGCQEGPCGEPEEEVEVEIETK